MPDPSTLDADGDDDVVGLETFTVASTSSWSIYTNQYGVQPLNIVQEKAKLDRSSSQRNASTSSQPAAPVRKPAQNIDLFGEDVPSITPPARPSTTDNPSVRPPPAKPANHSQSQLLGGLDFLGGPSDRPASASSKPIGSTGPSRPDLKQSILSLYATAPRSQPQPQSPPQHTRQTSFGGMQATTTQQSSAFGGLDDAFKGLTFTTQPTASASQPQQKPKLSSFGSFGQSSNQRSTAAAPQVTSTPLSGGGFFDTGPKPPPKPTSPPSNRNASPQTLRKVSNASDGFGEFNSALNPPTASSVATSANGLLDLSSPQSIGSARPANPSSNVASVFNLSAPKVPTQYQPVVQSSAPPTKTTFSAFSSAEPWGSSDPWASTEPAAPTPQTKTMKSPPVVSATTSDFSWGNNASNSNNSVKSPAVASATTSDFGWGNLPSAKANMSSGVGNGFSMPSPASGFQTEPHPGIQRFDLPSQPRIAADEDFGGWTSAAPETPAASAPAPVRSTQQAGKPAGGFAASDDLWSNVWQ